MAKHIYHLSRLGQRLHDTRVMLGLTQRDLAQQLNISERTVNRWEKGKNYPNPEQLAYIAEMSGRPIAYFFGVDEEEIYAFLHWRDNCR